MDNEFQVIAKNIKYLRGKRGYTQEQLAEAVGISPSHLSKVESGHRRIGMKAYLNILQVLNAEDDFTAIVLEEEEKKDFVNYQEIISDCSNDEKEFLFKMLIDIKVNMRVFMNKHYSVKV